MAGMIPLLTSRTFPRATACGVVFGMMTGLIATRIALSTGSPAEATLTMLTGLAIGGVFGGRSATRVDQQASEQEADAWRTTGWGGTVVPDKSPRRAA